VAGLTRIRARNVRIRFTGRCHTVVTRRARAGHLRVVDARRRIPRRRAVTGLTRIRARNMRIRFARCRGAVVT
jgi:hypothetical protein